MEGGRGQSRERNFFYTHSAYLGKLLVKLWASYKMIVKVDFPPSLSLSLFSSQRENWGYIATLTKSRFRLRYKHEPLRYNHGYSSHIVLSIPLENSVKAIAKNCRELAM